MQLFVVLAVVLKIRRSKTIKSSVGSDTLQSVWKERHGEKGLQFHSWFVNRKAKLVKNKMLRPVRIRAGLGNPPKPFFTNRVECGNSMISSETGHTKSAVDKFVAHVQGLSKRQALSKRRALGHRK